MDKKVIVAGLVGSAVALAGAAVIIKLYSNKVNEVFDEVSI